MYAIDDNMLRVYQRDSLVGPVFDAIRNNFLCDPQTLYQSPEERTRNADRHAAKQAERLMRSLGGG